jgi:uncharacterized membrane protein YvbJ
MAIITCPECGKEISDQASSCPGCGHPSQAQQKTAESQEKSGSGCGSLIVGIVCFLLFVIMVSTCGRSSTDTKPSAGTTSNLANKVDQNAKDGMASIINLNGRLCADVVAVYDIGGGQYTVDCVEYRDGTGRVSYTVDLNKGKVRPNK